VSVACVSIDVDPLGGDVLWERAIPRYLELLDRHAARATFFVVARELDRAVPRRWVSRIAAGGHEIASHTLDHPKRFGSLPPRELERQIAEAEPRIADAAGKRVVGFRAPAWDAEPSLFSCLEQRGYLYDSSVCPTWLAPVARLAARSRGVRPFGARRFAWAPSAPYHPDVREPWRRGSSRLVEVPTSIGALRLPIWLSPVLAAGPRATWLFRRALRGAAVPQWLFHGADLLDFDREVDPSLAYRPGLRRVLPEKVRMIESLLAELRVSGHALVPIEEVARDVA
jgi:peptidoglycan/xylan/chitin deacetylase (PgdA/CDA1 family)